MNMHEIRTSCVSGGGRGLAKIKDFWGILDIFQDQFHFQGLLRTRLFFKDFSRSVSTLEDYDRRSLPSSLWLNGLVYG